MEVHLEAWIQRADYSAEDVEHVSLESILKIWDSLDIQEMDSLQIRLMENEEDHCPWGLGIGWNTKSRIHVYRDSLADKTISVLGEEDTSRRVFGCIAKSSTNSTTLDNVTYDAVPSIIREYFQGVST